MTAGIVPELSVAIGLCQLTRTSGSVRSTFLMHFGQYVKTGGSVSENNA